MGWFNSLLVTTLSYVPKPIVGFFAKKYIAGEKLEDALNECKKLNEMGAMATVDLLGEFIKTQEEAHQCVEIYSSILEIFKDQELNANVSLKPTSLGAIFDQQLCKENIRKVVEKASEVNNFVRIDMENHPYTDLTLQIYEELRKEFPDNVGTVLQAYLKRTYQDADRLSKEGKTNLRLCKGIYKEPPSIAYKEKKRINENYLQVLDLLFSRGAYVGIATHDDELVDGALQLITKYKLTKQQYEFQMLLGVRPELRDRLLRDGHPLRIYTPYGEDWHPYSIRRLKENPDIMGNILREMFRR